MAHCEGLKDDGKDSLAKKDHPSKDPNGVRKISPSYRNSSWVSFLTWIRGKRVDDDVWPFWRIHDKLYDLTDFIGKHPGGQDWIEITQGTDITEAFESFHVTTKAEQLLPKYFVQDICKSRNSPYTFHDDGFYRTLKRKVRPLLQEIGRGPSFEMLLLQDGLMVTSMILLIAASLTGSSILSVLAGLVLALNTACAHNFIHQKDSFRMYYLDLSFFSSYEWRIAHVLSHHGYTNTLYDYELSVVEPFFVFFPRSDKSIVQRYGVVLYEWLILPWASYFEMMKRMFLWVSGTFQPRIENSFPFLELILTITLAPSVSNGIRIWVVTHCTCSAWLIFFFLAGHHHHVDSYHEGDALREQPDWGLCQLDTVRDKIGFVDNFFLVAVSFGDHGLHHLFPSVDHSKLRKLYPIFFETCKEFGLQYDFISNREMLRGKYVQLSRTTPKPIQKTPPWNLPPPGTNTKIE